MPKKTSRINSILTAPYRGIRTGIFSLIYPATILLNAMKLPLSVDIKEAYNDGITTVTPIKKALQQEINNPYHTQDDIDACIITLANEAQYDSNKQYIIHCDGNATYYQQLIPTLKQWCNRDTNIVAFNPPGVGFSTGVTTGPEVYMDTLKLMIEHLHAQGIPYENITLSGRSMGAAISTMVALDYQRENCRVKLFNDRSFGNMAVEAGMFVRNLFSNVLLRVTLGNLLYYTVNGLVRAFGLNFSPAKAFSEINTINPGDAHCTMLVDDSIIPENASVYANIPAEMQDKYGVKIEASYTPDELGEDAADYNAHNEVLESLTIVGSKTAASEYMASVLSAYRPQVKTEKQITRLSIELLETVNKTIIMLSQVDTNKLGSSKFKREVIDQLEHLNAQIGTQSSVLQAKFQNATDTNVKHISFAKELISIANQVQEACKAKELALSESAKIKRNFLPSNPAEVKVVPQKLADQNLEELQRNIELIAKNFKL